MAVMKVVVVESESKSIAQSPSESFCQTAAESPCRRTVGMAMAMVMATVVESAVQSPSGKRRLLDGGRIVV